MNKQEEIQVLQSLKGDTYFNQYFTNQDIDTMCENIRNDFGIECSIDKLEAASKLPKVEKDKDDFAKGMERYMAEVDKKTDEIDELAHFMAEQAQKWSATDLREKAIEMMGAEEYIKFRLRKGWDLWESDKEMLIKML